MLAAPSDGISVNANAGRIVDRIVSQGNALRCQVSIGDAGERRIDCGAAVPGCLELGRLLAEVCMGGLGTVQITGNSPLDKWPLAVMAHATDPVLACLGSQYAGWTISDDASGFFALGSGPARALSRVEAIYDKLSYADDHDKAILVIEGDTVPPTSVARLVARECGVPTKDLTILFAPTWSLAGTVQIGARILEVALHKAHELHFPLENIIDGYGIAPLPPPVPDFVKAMGRTNDGIIYGGRIQLFVRGDDTKAKELAENLPSCGSPAYGKPFAEIFAEVEGDFYKIDPMLFSPAVVTVSNLDSGSSFHAGELAPEIVDASFS